jgi:hypothetical protein
VGTLLVSRLEQLSILLSSHSLHKVRINFTNLVHQQLVGCALLDLATPRDWSWLCAHQFFGAVYDAALEKDRFL